MACDVKCTFFPDMTCRSFTIDENGIKRRNDGKQYICGYDGHIITDWTSPCPKEEDKLIDLNQALKHLTDF